MRTRRGGTSDAHSFRMGAIPPHGEHDDRNVRDRAENAVDRSRNLRQLIVLQRMLRKLADERRRDGRSDTTALD